jgi:hypothetical protein
MIEDDSVSIADPYNSTPSYETQWSGSVTADADAGWFSHAKVIGSIIAYTLAPSQGQFNVKHVWTFEPANGGN